MKLVIDETLPKIQDAPSFGVGTLDAMESWLCASLASDTESGYTHEGECIIHEAWRTFSPSSVWERLQAIYLMYLVGCNPRAGVLLVILGRVFHPSISGYIMIQAALASLESNLTLRGYAVEALSQWSNSPQYTQYRKLIIESALAHETNPYLKYALEDLLQDWPSS